MTPTQERIIELLSDGLAHTKEELSRCLWDELADPNTVRVHISILRRTLRPRGQDIVCQPLDGTCTYRHVRLVSIAGE